MPVPASSLPITLDVTTLFVVATFLTGLLGAFLLLAWARDRNPALAWWGAAYLIGSCSAAAWSLGGLISPPMPAGIANALLFVAYGMTWNAARVFHARPVLVGAPAAGAAVWLFACMFADFAQWPAARIALSSLVVASYAFLTAGEMWRERRKTLRRRWPAVLVPMLHGALFLLPIPLASLLRGDLGNVTVSPAWVALFVLETMLYAVVTAFIVLDLAQEQVLRFHKDAASTDALTGILNRRGVLQAAQGLIADQARKGRAVSALIFDLDHFKQINDRFGHAVGDKALQLFAATARASTRATDVVGRLGGEEFVAILPGTLADAKIVAERVRRSFEAAALKVAGHGLDATVSIGAASGESGTDIVALLAAADAALYRAKGNGRNRVELAQEGEKPAAMPVLFASADAPAAGRKSADAAPLGALGAEAHA